ncbi:tudor domain superfamily protein [Schizosaccharomyces pombe]|uniref:Putative primary metabolism protein prl65 n=1 Tax=Schizosaccharomyces pombe (strain 972 / ATCC 24843) TaxID=284812 RepID=PRL65_SCHPO|nr:protein prl65 [Schizosaccharomyces pombe]G2TRL4.1 RecName: Full=Uncharacterized protein prl65 [Schizosaccharomyces pombe 972h-]CCD31319.1 conserved fungal protein [Schizosaccharomyces pombe]|eukprot:NP_001343109.1 protein prl65 [Schizosaccharomyces pombe]
MTKYSKGNKVEYHPIGGPSGTSTSTGVIQQVIKNDSGEETRYEILNDHTGKAATYKERNISRILD